MKYSIVCLVLVVAMVAPYHGYAATEGVYVTAGVSTFKYSGLKPSKPERDLLGSSGVTANYSADGKSTNNELGVGYCINKYFCADVSYTRGVKMKTRTQVTSINGGPIIIGGNTIILNSASYVVNGTTYSYPGGSYAVPVTTVNPGNYATNIRLDRDGEASALRLAISGEYPLTERIGVIGRIGVYRWKATVVDKISVDNSGLYLAYNEYDKGTAPMASVGVNYKFTDKADVGVDYFHIKRVTMTTVNIRYWL